MRSVSLRNDWTDLYNVRGFEYLRKHFHIRRPKNMLFIYDRLNSESFVTARKIAFELGLDQEHVTYYLRQLWLKGYAKRKLSYGKNGYETYKYRLSSKKLMLEHTKNLYEGEG